MMSLSIVLGMPTIDFFRPRFSISFAISEAPRSVPSPPTTKRMSICISSSVSTMSLTSCGPRELPRIVPPKLCTCAMDSGRSVIGVWP
jgi:hypothetical protein